MLFRSIGWGFDSARAIPGGTARPPVGSEMLPLHPHNSILQSWLELGLPGALAAGALLGWAFLAARGPSTGPSTGDAASRAAVAAAFCAISFTAYGMWQNWWLAGTWLALAITATLTGAAAQRGGSDGRTGRG